MAEHAALRLALESVSLTFHGEHRSVPALREVSMDVRPEEFVTLIGPSGCGKSTLFNLITGLLEPETGHIRIDGTEVSDRTGYVAYMPQRDLLLPWRSVLDNVTLPLEIHGEDRTEARRRARELVPRFGLEGFADHYPQVLSGGMRQRAAFLRTVMSGRETLLLDEPFGALDALTRRQLQDWLLDLQRSLRRTILFITHDVDEAVYLADRVVVLSERPGRVIKVMKVELPRPRHQRMIAEPLFGQYVTELLDALGLDSAHESSVEDG
ncbi:MAG: ABC transporter ATP-binding protein [Spirochaetaceae bacterium]